MNHRKHVCLWLVFVVTVIEISTFADDTVPNCTESALIENSLPASAGQLLYIPYGESLSAPYPIVSTQGSTQLTVPNYWGGNISPSGQWLVSARIDQENSTYEVVVQSINRENKYEISIEPFNPYLEIPIWLNDEELLVNSLFGSSKPPEHHPYAIINPFLDSLEYVFPYNWTYGDYPSPYADVTTNPILWEIHEGAYFRISPDGQYAIYVHDGTYGDGGRHVYLDGIENDVFLDLEQVVAFSHRLIKIPIWSPDSHFLAVLSPLDEDESDETIFLYDLEQDQIQSVNGNPEYLSPTSYEPGSWSPDGRYIALRALVTS